MPAPTDDIDVVALRVEIVDPIFAETEVEAIYVAALAADQRIVTLACRPAALDWLSTIVVAVVLLSIP